MSNSSISGQIYADILIDNLTLKSFVAQECDTNNRKLRTKINVIAGNLSK